MFKKAKVVMLPTNEKATLKSDLAINENNLLFQPSKLEGTWFFLNKFQHLYILSDDEIKEGDWFIKMNYNGGKPTVYQENKSAFMNSEWLNSSDVKDCFKIIATTDSSLTIPATNSGRYVYQLPSPSQSFIEKYVAEYNKGNVITDVLVEYEEVEGNCDCYYTKFCKAPKHLKTGELCRDEKHLKLKVNPKDNTITIKKVKDSWSREEVLKLTKIAALVAFIHPEVFAEGVIFDDNKFNKWIEENL